MSKYSKYMDEIYYESCSLIEEMEIIELKIQADRNINVIKIGGSKMTNEEDIVYCDDATDIKKKKIEDIKQAKFDKEREAREKAITQVKAILREHDMKLSVGACNCCDSPWVAFEHKGVVVLDATGANFDMFEEEEVTHD